MALVDKIQVLIEADASGLSTQLKRGADMISQFVSNMNDNSVNWEKILSGSISPAIITGIASMYALAIEQSLNFQEAMNTQGTAAGDTAAQTAAVGTAALTVASQTGQGATDVASAMLALSAIFKDTNDQQSIANDMSMLAASGFGSLADIVKTMIPLFQQWGVTSSAQAESFLTSMMHAAEGAKESIPTIAAQFSGMTPDLILAGTKLTEVNGILASFSADIATVGASGAQAIFDGIAQGASDASSPFAIFGGGVEAIRKSLADNGGLDVIKKLSDTMSTKFGDDTGLIAKALGFTAQGAAALVMSGREFPTVSKDASDIATSVQSIRDAFDQSDSVLRHLQEDWNKVKAQFTSPDMATALGQLLKLVEDIGGELSLLKIPDILINTLETAVQAATIFSDMLKSGLAGVGALGGAVVDVLQGKFASIIPDLQKNFKEFGGSLMGDPNSPLTKDIAAMSQGGGFVGAIAQLTGGAIPPANINTPTAGVGASTQNTTNNVTNNFNISTAGGSPSMAGKSVMDTLYSQGLSGLVH